MLALSLSWIGGYTDLAVLLASGAFVSHISGNTAQVGHWLGAGDFAKAGFFAAIVGMFTVGAALSGFLTESAKRRGWRSEYILPVGLEALLLAALAFTINASKTPTHGWELYLITGLGAMAMGLQNATITKVSGAVIRTTHVTGIFTDFGLEGVQYAFWWIDQIAKRRWDRAGRLLKVSGRHPAFLRLVLLASIALSFGLGAAAGTMAYEAYSSVVMLPPVCFLLGLVYLDWHRPIADIRELDPLRDPELGVQGIISELLPPEVGFYRASCLRARIQHRAPDFQLWIDRVPLRVRVLVLAVSPQMHFDANAVMDLQNASRRLEKANKKLVLSGVTPAQYRAIDALGGIRTMDPASICPDMEFAIARAMAVLQEVSPSVAERLEQAADAEGVLASPDLPS